MELDLGESKALIPSLLNQFFDEENYVKKLNMAYTIVCGLEPNIFKATGGEQFKGFLNKFLTNVVFIKKLKLYVKINENIETAIEYLGRDYMTHEEFIFDPEFEKLILEMNKRINQFIGKLLKEYAKSESIEI